MLANEFEKQLQTHGEITDNFFATPDSSNIFDWYFVLFGLKDCPYEGGYYFGKIEFPKEYPFAPPDIIFLSESGRFEVNYKICFSFTAYHKNEWNPALTVRLMLLSILSFIGTNEHTLGAVRTTNVERKRIASNSK